MHTLQAHGSASISEERLFGGSDLTSCRAWRRVHRPPAVGPGGTLWSTPPTTLTEVNLLNRSLKIIGFQLQ